MLGGWVFAAYATWRVEAYVIPDRAHVDTLERPKSRSLDRNYIFLKIQIFDMVDFSEHPRKTPDRNKKRRPTSAFWYGDLKNPDPTNTINVIIYILLFNPV